MSDLAPEWGRQALSHLQSRASCRAFRDDPIPDEVLEEILATGLRAASGGNLQPYSIIVVRDAERRRRLAEINYRQSFIAQAPVNLLIVLDFHKLERYARLQDAPFTAHRSFSHFLVGFMDAICCAQMMETAAWLLGIGTCYVGTVPAVAPEVVKLCSLPPRTFPLLLLAMGYPRSPLRTRPRLPRSLSVFEERYPALSDDEILEGFAAKYGTEGRSLPSDPARAERWLRALEEALLTTYRPEEVRRITSRVRQQGKVTEAQRYFGLHYHAARMPEVGRSTLRALRQQGIDAFSDEEDAG